MYTHAKSLTYLILDTLLSPILKLVFCTLPTIHYHCFYLANIDFLNVADAATSRPPTVWRSSHLWPLVCLNRRH